MFRLGEIVWTVCYQGIWQLTKRLFASRKPNKKPSSFLGEWLCHTFESLGGTFIKIGQIISTRPDIFPPGVTVPLSRLQDQVKPFPAKLIPAIIAENFNQPIQAIFPSFDIEPDASGSIAQVHRAQLVTGEEVAVKIRRPGITHSVKQDFKILRLFAKTVNWLPFMKLVPFVELVEEFRITIEGQINFLKEANANKIFSQNFSSSEHILIPKLYEHLCTSSMLVMEYFPGLSKSDFSHLTEFEREMAAKAGLQAIYQMMFKDGFIHGDLHPANVYFLEDGKILLLDFGLIAELKGSELDDYIEFFFAMSTNNGKTCADIVNKTALYHSPKYNASRFEADMVALVNWFYNQTVADFEVSQFAMRLFDVQRRNGVKGATHFITTILALVVFEGLVKQLYPALDFQDEARKFLIQLMGLEPELMLEPTTLNPSV